MAKTIKMPEMRRSAEVRPQTLDPKTRTFKVIFSTGARVLTQSYYINNGEPFWEELSLDPAHVRLGRFNNGAPFMRMHDRDYRSGRDSLDNTLGVIESSTVDGVIGEASVRLSQRVDVDPIYQDINDGILRHSSVGYHVYKYRELQRAEDGLRVLLAVDWEPLELSLIPIGADDAALVRSRDNIVNECVITYLEENMSLELKKRQNEQGVQDPKIENGEGDVPKADGQAPTQQAAQEPSPEAQNDGVVQERERAYGIRMAVRAAKLDESVADEMVASGVRIEKARELVLERLYKRDQEVQTRSHVTVGEDKGRTAFIDGCSNALRHRANPGIVLQDVAREYRGMNLMDMARESIERAGGRSRGLSRREIAVAALSLDRNIMARAGMHSTSDFPEILAGTVNRTLREGYALAERTFTPWCRKSTNPDFKEVARVLMSEMSKMQSVKEGGEYKHLTFGDSAEKYALGKSGGIVSITWESIINDDLSAFERIPMMLVSEAAALEGDAVYGILTGNPNMADGTALFHADHANLTSQGTAISVASLGVGRAMIRKQKGPKNRVLNLKPSFLIVGPDKEAEANQYTSTQYVAAQPSAINPPQNTSLTPIVDARISGNAWFLVVAPGLVDTIEYAYLEGEEGLFTEQRQGFEVDGIEIKARHVFAAKAIDFRSMYKNVGA